MLAEFTVEIQVKEFRRFPPPKKRDTGAVHLKQGFLASGHED